MNKIEKRELKDELKFEDTVVLTYRIEYPEIVSSDYEYGKDVFNKYNKEKALTYENYVKTQLYSNAVELYKYNSSNGYPIMVYEIVTDYTVTYNEDAVLSLYFDQYEFSGGAHGNTIRSSQNWDLISCVILPLYYFYPNNPYFILEILKSIIEQIRIEIQEGVNQYFDDYCGLVVESFNPENYYLTEDSIAIYFQQYDIAPYSSGIPVFNIPYVSI